MITKEMLLKRIEELTGSLQNINQQIVKLQEQIGLHKGAIEQCSTFLKELEKNCESTKMEESK